ncbi:MAG: hypothetical protein IT515_13830 [Burkholderiales bacterium]|nr:hypothetical protein [Burkholderiales bacterium]
MTILYGVFATQSASADPATLASLAQETDSPGPDHAVFDKPSLALRLRGAAATGAATVASGTTLDGVEVAVVGRPLARPGAALDIPRLEWPRLRESLSVLDGYWLAFAHDENSRSLEVLCDRLGVAWLYWAMVPGGVAFSSDFGALARALPERPRLNDAACLQMLTVTYPTDDTTCFEEMQVVSPRALLTFRGGSVLTRERSRPSYGDRWVGATQKAKFEALDAALDRGYEAWSLGSGARQWAVALSGGNDSRYALGVLLRHQERPSCATFGMPGSSDVRGAVAVCSREQLRHELFVTGRRTSWDSWRAGVQRLGVVAGYQYGAGWAHDWRETLRALDGQVVLGYLGDALSGRHLVDHYRGDWLANWEAWSLDLRDDGTWTGSDMLRPEARERARAVARAALRQASEGIQCAFDHQRALHLDLMYRQRRIVASQINFLSDEMPVGPLFYTSAMIDFWSNLAFDDLQGQALYLAYACARFPNLFAAARPPPLSRRVRGTLSNLLVGLVPSLQSYLTPQEIDIRALVAHHIEQLRALLQRHGDAVAHIIDVAALNGWLDRFRTREGIRAPQYQRFWNLLLLVDSGMSGRSD